MMKVDDKKYYLVIFKYKILIQTHGIILYINFFLLNNKIKFVDTIIGFV